MQPVPLLPSPQRDSLIIEINRKISVRDTYIEVYYRNQPMFKNGINEDYFSDLPFTFSKSMMRSFITLNLG
jgi:hypothetical protein